MRIWKLEAQINQHIQVNICKENMDNFYRRVNVSGSALVEHLIKNQQYAQSYSLDMFSLLSRANSDYY